MDKLPCSKLPTLSKLPVLSFAPKKLRRSMSATDLTTITKMRLKQPPSPHTGTALSVIDHPASSKLHLSSNTSKEPVKKTTRAKNLRPSMSVTDLSSIGKITLKRGGPTTTASTNIRKRPAVASKSVVPAKVVKSNVQKDTKSSTSKENTKPPAQRIPPYDYKARFANIKERFDKFKSQHVNCSELVKEYEDLKEQYECLNDKFCSCDMELKMVRLKYDESSKQLEKTKTDFVELKSKCDKFEINFKKQLDENVTVQKMNNELKSENELLKSDLTEYEKSNLEQKKRLVELDYQRRFLHNLVQELKGNIRVFCRVRPPLASEDLRKIVDISYLDDKIELSIPQSSMKGLKTGPLTQDFSYDKVFPPSTSQKEIYEELDMFVQSALDGYNVCVFAYGQTGSGKTYTMQGVRTEDGRGMIPRTVESLFKRIKHLSVSGWKYEVQVSFLEVYNEVVKDLLNPQSKLPHDIKHNEGKGVIITNLDTRAVNTCDELLELIRRAEINRSVAVTNYNEHSSRSHAVTKISLNGIDGDQKMILKGSINLVDLAGSENAKLSTNDTMTETKHINKSLAALGNVMLALHNGNKHIPYRDSKLTYLLASCLGGDSKTLMFLNISPFEDCYAESLNALRFAQKVKNVKMNFKKNKCYL